MSNTNLQTQASNALHNAIMEAGGKDRPPIIHPINSNGLRRPFQLQKVVQKPLQNGIDNDIYFTVDAWPNTCEMWKAIERLKQGESINVQDLETNLYWEFGKSTSRDGEPLESYYSRMEKEYGHVARECQKPKRAKDAAYHKEKMLLCKQEEARFQLNAEQVNWRDDTDDEPEDQELKAHYLEHPEQPESVNDTYLEEQGDTNITIDSLDMSTNGETVDQDDNDDLAKKRDLLSSLIEKLKCEIDDSKNRNKFLESSNKTLIDKLRGEIEDFKTINKILKSSNNHFKVANMNVKTIIDVQDLKKFQAELDSFVKPENLKKAQRANPRLYDIGCYNDNLALMEYYYADHMNAILGVYTTLDEFTDLQCDYVDQVVKCERLEKELSKSKTMSKSFEALQKHAINLELALQQCKEQIKNDKAFKENQSNVFLKEREQYFEIQDLKAQLQDKGIAISELKKLIEKMKGKSVETKFEKPLVIRQPNAFKSQRQSVLGKLTTFLDSLEKKDFSKPKSVTTNYVSNDFSKPVTA
ncbi:hypothetical protein Tco_1030627 [Tanacetum coccineum]|uniref:Uncharacterized protein n=1 Tax=Tanacetum coccineum TaxID=301880 RepID=A0ABQ5G6R4_9ASTR